MGGLKREEEYEEKLAVAKRVCSQLWRWRRI